MRSFVAAASAAREYATVAVVRRFAVAAASLISTASTVNASPTTASPAAVVAVSAAREYATVAVVRRFAIAAGLRGRCVNVVGAQNAVVPAGQPSRAACEPIGSRTMPEGVCWGGDADDEEEECTGELVKGVCVGHHGMCQPHGCEGGCESLRFERVGCWRRAGLLPDLDV